ncbi:MAG: 5-(carboxyamino)imidazole ribonucleotide synthase [Crocinitomicaceae bacterium]|nr:5-(carboxyamino)imidazole ribonucleotide synthase [Crocinitomicaceae bacterium]
MISKWYGKDLRLGVLGGGQLGRMLIQAANDLNIHIHCLDPDPNAPCSEIAHSFSCGSLTDYNTVLNFGSDKHLITVEIENVNVEALVELEKKGVKVFPQPNILKLIQDKGLQKEFYLKNSIPTAAFEIISSKAELLLKTDFPFVHKLRKGGYDGKGVKIISNLSEAEQSFDAPSVIEEKIDFQKELSVLVARNEKGEIKTFPLVECEFNPEANLVEFLFSPADVSPEIELKAKEIASQLIEKLNMVGLLAVELFLTKSNELLVNEIAPRPHNSGHHTIECSTTSQFSQHLRAILNLPLGDTSLIQAGAMINLVGEKEFNGPVIYDGLENLLSIPGVFPHLYGKEISKPFRKMGHITITGKNIDELKAKRDKIKGLIRVISR